MISKALLMQRRYFSSAGVTKNITKVGVIGLGLMGHGIAQVTAQAGYEVVAVEATNPALEVGIKRIEDSLKKVIAREVKNQKITEAQGKENYDKIRGRITVSTELDKVRDCDLIVEALPENIDLKLKFFQDLAQKTRLDSIFASNTSSLAIAPMAKASLRPQNFVGLHFFNPVQIMKLVEIIKTTETTPEVYDHIVKYCKTIGKESVTCGDTPGFIVNRLLVPYMTQAMAIVDRKHATIRDIDVSMQLGAGHPMGPLHLADYVGLDTCFNIVTGWVKEFPNEKAFFVPEVLKQKVAAGHLGRKSGKGFYHWNGDVRGDPVE